MSEPSFVVLKFGGTSVSKREYWMTIAEALRDSLAQGQRPIVVCSALSKVSDQLHQLVDEVGLNPDEVARVDTILSRYQDFAQELGISDEVLHTSFDALRRLTQGVALLGESSPTVRAQIMAFGELMLTQLGAEFLRSQGLDTHWQDVREWFESKSDRALSEEQNVLSAVCPYGFDEVLVAKLNAIPNAVVITQGFIAKDERGRTVLLGRGGSDTSAAYLAAKIGAKKCEIWTDVPGVYTTNPGWVSEARLIKQISYEEAREIALGGAKVLHPYCIDPLMLSRIPLLIKCTANPHQESTIISSLQDQNSRSAVKAISLKKGVCLISLETTDMWRQVGFLATIFDCFRKHGVSVNLVATAENNVTVTLDVVNHLLSRESIQKLLQDLERYAAVKFIDSCAVISLVGSRIRSSLHKLTNVFGVFEEQKIYLLTQATNDLNLSLVVEEADAETLLRKMHASLFEQGPLNPDFGARAGALRHPNETPWWKAHQEKLKALSESETPRYVYYKEAVKNSIRKLKSISNVSQFFFAIKANSNAELLTLIQAEGLGLECVSIGELQRVLGLFPKMEPSRILFTPNFAERREYEAALAANVLVNLDNLHPLEHWPEIFVGREIFVRIDTGISQGHHQHVKTGGKRSKFGISPSQIPRLKELTQKHGVKVVGLHAHMGSGVLNPDSWAPIGLNLGEIAREHFPLVRVLNVGGGLGVPEKTGDPGLRMKAVEDSLSQVKGQYPEYNLWLEPGRYLVAEAGVILAKVTQLKQKEDVHFVGLDVGMNSLIRPCLYGAFHEILNLSRLDEPATKEVHVVGPICETGDTLGHSRFVPESTAEGDVFLIATAGAYGYVMGSHYNLREPAGELVI